MLEITEKEFVMLRDFLLNNYGIDLSKKKMLIQGRLSVTLQKRGFQNFADYIDVVKQDKTGVELQSLLNRLTTNLTYFLREKEHFDYLTATALPALQKNKGGKPLRIWSAGCSSGEEPYTLAMTLLDYFQKSGGSSQFVILASDISQNVLSRAQNGVYATDAFKDVPHIWMTKYFDKVDDDNYQVKPEVRKCISFKTFNLMDPFRFSAPFEIIFCRNVMIYFDKEKKEKLIQKFHDWTTPNGYFFISHSENIGRSDVGYRMLKPSIFRRTD